MAYYINKLNQKIAYRFIKGRNPGIIFVHGLNSDMNGLKALSIEKYAKKNKISFLRFDCRGHGKSFGKFEDFSISEWKIDLINLLDNITVGPQILIGSSMGGWLTMLATKSRIKRIHGIIGLAAAVDFGNSMYNNLPKKNKNEIIKKGITNYNNSGFSYKLTKRFFNEANNNRILNKPFKFNKPMILIHGLKDKVVKSTMPMSILKKTSGEKIQINYLKSSDHRLSSNNDIKFILSTIDIIRKIK